MKILAKLLLDIMVNAKIQFTLGRRLSMRFTQYHFSFPQILLLPLLIYWNYDFYNLLHIFNHQNVFSTGCSCLHMVLFACIYTFPFYTMLTEFEIQ